jgi:hypothetical protein
MNRWLAILALFLGLTSDLPAKLIHVEVHGYPELILWVPDSWNRIEIYWEWSEALSGPWQRCILLSPYDDAPRIDRGETPIYLRLRARRLDAEDPSTGRSNYVPPYWWHQPSLSK